MNILNYMNDAVNYINGSVGFYQTHYNEFGPDYNEECAICHDPFEDDPNKIIMNHPKVVDGKITEENSSHPMHGQCLEGWLKFHTRCPVCNVDIERSWKEKSIMWLECLKENKTYLMKTSVIALAAYGIGALFPQETALRFGILSTLYYAPWRGIVGGNDAYGMDDMNNFLAKIRRIPLREPDIALNPALRV